jgi:hypothetical protein
MPVAVPHSPIEVNFNVLIDASGNLEVFNAAKPVVANVVVAEHTLPVTALYDANGNKGLIELWEPVEAQGDIKVQLADTDLTASGGINLVGAYQTASKTLASGLEAILCDTFDCSAASPFTAYTGNVEYYKQRDFGRVALATYSHYMFGHVDATAAITNDKAFVQGLLSVAAGGDDETAGGAAARAAAWTKSTAANVQLWDNTSSGTDANLALRLVKAVVGKGLNGAGAPITSLVSANDSASLANIVSQVVGQDASRLMNVDNSQRTRDQHIVLRFYAGDVIYMNIKLKTPAVNVGTKNQVVSGATLQSMYTEENFTMKITLANPYVAPPAPPAPPAITTSPLTAGQSAVVVQIGTVYSTDVLNLPAYQANVGKLVEFIFNTATKNIVAVKFASGLYAEAPFADIATNPNALTLEYGNMTSELTLRSPSSKAFKTFFYTNSAAIVDGAVGDSVGMKFNLEDVAGSVFGAMYTSVNIVAKGSA